MQEVSQEKSLCIHPVDDVDSDASCESVDLYSPTYAFKGVKQYMVQPEIKATKSSRWKEVKMQIDNGAAANCLNWRTTTK